MHMTTLINRCRACSGKKKLLGLGGMMKDCIACKGIGYVETQLDKPNVNPFKVTGGTVTIEPEAAAPVRKTLIDLTKPKPRTKGRPAVKPHIDLTVVDTK